MTIHFGFDYQCPDCEEAYLPFDEEQRTCPQCGKKAPEGAPSIAEIVNAAKFNNEYYRLFMPLSVADAYVANAMLILARTERRVAPTTDEKQLEAIVSELVDEMITSNGKEYLRAHTNAFVKGVLKEAYLHPAASPN